MTNVFSGDIMKRESQQKGDIQMDKKIKIGFIGTGGIAHGHMKAYIKREDVEIVAGCDIVPGKAKAFFEEFGLENVRCYESHKEMLEAFHEIYEGAGYPVMEVSALTGEGIDALREACKGHVSLFSGVSGVGKSSLIKALDPSLNPRVGEISDVHLQGKHTTTFYEMYALSSRHPESDEESKGFIVDTPGLRGFGLVDLKKEEIALYFPEMLKASEGCRFTPCTHTHEPGCAVKEAVEAGEISYDRYSSYLGMRDEEGKYR